MFGSDNITRGIRVQVQPEFDPERSSPGEQRWLFRYHITISNEGEETVQLLNRHWIITDGDGRVEEVQGPGVIGHHPVLPPGESFSYSSFCPLPTSVGTMHGSYEMVNDQGESFGVEIAPFTLSEPYSIN